MHQFGKDVVPGKRHLLQALQGVGGFFGMMLFKISQSL
jgi:hypothetical protein